VKSLTLVSQMLNGGDPAKIAAQLEGMLYSKAESLVENQKKQVANSLLEADMKPAVWKDHEDNPVIPRPDEWARYFEDIAMSHVKAQLEAAHERWAAAESKAKKAATKADTDATATNKSAAKLAAAEFKALGMEIKAAESDLKRKLAAGSALAKVQAKKRDVKAKAIHGVVNSAARSLFQGSPMLTHAVHHITNAVLNHVAKPKA